MENLDIYKKERKAFVAECLMKKYKGIPWTASEEKANIVFMKLVDQAKSKIPEDFYYDQAIKYGDLMETLPLFNFLKEIPKGALLHNHEQNDIDLDWFVEMTYNPNVYERKVIEIERETEVCVYTMIPKPGYKSIAQMRKDYIKANPSPDSEKKFNEQIKDKLKFTLEEICSTKNNKEIWPLFFDKIFYPRLVLYKGFIKEHYLRLFRRCIKEKIYRYEGRPYPNIMTDENENLIGIEAEMEIYREISNEIKKECPIFTFGLIYTILRHNTNEEAKELMAQIFLAKSKCPDIVIAIDVAGDEDHLRSNFEFVPVLVTKGELEKKYGFTLPFILHSGESISLSNENVIDAVLLKSKRFGHGLDVIKHSYILERVKADNICIETNPISNQLLHLVRDLRLHPAIAYMNMGIPVIIGNDDPSTYRTVGMCYDLTVAILAFEMNLRDVKLIFYNSINYSECDKEIKSKLMEKFNEEWEEMIKKMVK